MKDPKMLVNGDGQETMFLKKKGIWLEKAGSEIRNRIGKQNLQPFYQKKKTLQFRVDP